MEPHTPEGLQQLMTNAGIREDMHDLLDDSVPDRLWCIDATIDGDEEMFREVWPTLSAKDKSGVLLSIWWEYDQCLSSIGDNLYIKTTLSEYESRQILVQLNSHHIISVVQPVLLHTTSVRR